MIISASKIELFKNLSYLEYGISSYDLHNNFDCIELKFHDDVLSLIFTNTTNEKYHILLRFYNVIFTILDFSFESQQPLTIDNLYRGRAEVKGELKEYSGDKGYFYLEFYEGQKIEFWSNGLSLNETSFDDILPLGYT